MARKRIRIPKDRDIRELLKFEEEQTSTQNRYNASKEFRDRINYSFKYEDKKVQKFCIRRDAELADIKREDAYRNAMRKLGEQQEK